MFSEKDIARVACSIGIGALSYCRHIARNSEVGMQAEQQGRSILVTTVSSHRCESEISIKTAWGRLVLSWKQRGQLMNYFLRLAHLPHNMLTAISIAFSMPRQPFGRSRAEGSSEICREFVERCLMPVTDRCHDDGEMHGIVT